MTKSLQNLRGTGRTTRLLEHARKLALEGRAVYVITDNERDARRLQLEFGTPSHGVKFETPASLGYFNWECMRTPGAAPNRVFLVDHHAIEDRFSKVLEMLHAYDEPDMLAKLFLSDPENQEELRLMAPPRDLGNGSFQLDVSSRDGTRKWRHTIRTEEI